MAEGSKANESGAPAVAEAAYKRPFDLAVLAAAGILLAPLWLLLFVAVSLAIWLEDRGPVIYAQPRLGLGGRVFNLLKFRTMIVGAEESTGPVWAADRDSRLTRVGRVLRRFHLDEMPQLVNVAVGEMSLVGPRPERPELAARIGCEVPGFESRLQVRPGIAGLAQAFGGYDTHPRDKLRYDNLYIATMTALLDVKLLLLCLWTAMSGQERVRPGPASQLLRDILLPSPEKPNGNAPGGR